MPSDPSPPLPEPLADATAPLTAPRARLLRGLVHLRTVLWVVALIAIAVYFAGGMRPGVRLAVFIAYGVVAALYVGIYLYARFTRRETP